MDGMLSQDEINALCAQLRASADLVGLLQRDCNSWNKQVDTISVQEIEAMIEQRRLAKMSKDFAKADEIRTTLLNRNVILEDSPNGAKITIFYVCHI